MNRFSLVRLPTLDGARARVAEDPARRVFRAGGTDLLDRMKEGLDAPEQLVELRAIDGDTGSRMRDMATLEGGGWRIGTLVTVAQVGDARDLPPAYDALREAAGQLATPGIRNGATVGGNLLQRPRCWYYRHEDLVCLKKGGPACLASTGRNAFHAILGGGPCHIVHPSSLSTPLSVLDATAAVAGEKGERTLPIAELFRLPSVAPSGTEHTLDAGEVLLDLTLPAPEPDRRSVYEAAREKQSFDWPLAEAAVSLRLQDNRMTGVRIALGHVAPIPWRTPPAEQILEGQAPSTEIFARAAKAALAGAKPLSDNAYKVRLAQGVLRQALHRATGTALPA